MKRQILAAFAALLVLVPAEQALKADQAPYTIEDLGQTADGRAPTVTGLNAKGQLSGYVFMADGSPRAVRFTDGFGWEYLPGLENSVAYGINASGDLVGYRINADGMYRAYRYSDGVGVSDIEPVDDALFTFGFAINDAGTWSVRRWSETDPPSGSARSRTLPPCRSGRIRSCAVSTTTAPVVGEGAAPPPGNSHAYRLDAAGNLTDIPSFVGPDGHSTACAVGEDGRVGGQAFDGFADRAFAYTDDRPGESRPVRVGGQQHRGDRRRPQRRHLPAGGLLLARLHAHRRWGLGRPQHRHPRGHRLGAAVGKGRERGRAYRRGSD